MASVVIPAHNEGRVIDRCLTALAASSVGGALEVVVAANGCTDDTVARAGAHPGVRVLDLAEPSKIGALNAGDAVATAFPRLYLDGDVELTPDAVDSLVALLTTEEPRVAAPSVRYVTESASWPVRAFYRVFAELPSARLGIAGHGVYAVSAAGRRRFATFPDVQGDDLYVARLFRPGEQVRAAGESLVQTPRNLRNLLRVRTRIARGNAELAALGTEGGPDFARTTGSTLRSALALARRRPRHIPDVAVFLAVSVASRLGARRAGDRWHRDTSTR